MALEKASIERLLRRPFLVWCSKEMMKGRRSSGREGGSISTGPVYFFSVSCLTRW